MTLFFNGKLKRTAQIGAVVGVAALGVTYAAAPVVFASALGYVATALASVGALSILTQLGVVLAAGLSMALLAAAAGALVFCLGHAIYNAARPKSTEETSSEDRANQGTPLTEAEHTDRGLPQSNTPIDFLSKPRGLYQGFKKLYQADSYEAKRGQP